MAIFLTNGDWVQVTGGDREVPERFVAQHGAVLARGRTRAYVVFGNGECRKVPFKYLRRVEDPPGVLPHAPSGYFRILPAVIDGGTVPTLQIWGLKVLKPVLSKPSQRYVTLPDGWRIDHTGTRMLGLFDADGQLRAEINSDGPKGHEFDVLTITDDWRRS